MAAPKRRAAEIMFWKSPLDQKCTLQPLDDKGTIELDIVDGEVHVHSRNCLYTVETDAETIDFELSEFEFSIPMSQCQINWHSVEKGTVEEVERCIHFRE